MTCLILREQDIRPLIDMTEAVAAIERLMQTAARRAIDDVPRRRVRLPGVTLHLLASGSQTLGQMAWKAYTSTRQQTHFHLGLYDQHSGQLLSLMQADWLGQLRTGAIIGVAARRLGVTADWPVALIGAGRQAYTQLAALVAACDTRSATVFCRDPQRREDFARRVEHQLGVNCLSASTPADACQAARVVVTATTSHVPVVSADQLPVAELLVAIGSNSPGRQELDLETLASCGWIACDNFAGCQSEAGELLAAVEAGRFQWEQLHRLEELFGPPLEHYQPLGEYRRCLIKTVGWGAADLALASLIWERAQQRSVGQWIDF